MNNKLFGYIRNICVAPATDTQSGQKQNNGL